jgi:RND family efflux transporter MFP subunit
MRKEWWYLAAAALVGATVWFVAHRPAPDTPQADVAPVVALATVRVGAFAVVLDEAGSAGAPAASTAQLAFASAGILRSIYVHAGDRVSAGEALAALDLRPLELAAQGAQADAQAADAQAAAAAVNRYATRITVDRTAAARAQRLYAAGVIAFKDVEEARATLAADEADARSAHANRVAMQAQAASAMLKAQSAQGDLERATLRSPSDGVVTAILHRPGEAVDPSTPVVTIGSAQPDVATLHVPSSDVAQIAVGDEADVTISGSAQPPAKGHVIAVVPSVDPATQSATVVIAGLPAGALAGAAVNARITVAHVRGMLVPQAAIVSDPQSGNDVVFVQTPQKDGSVKFSQRIVTVAHEDGNTALVSAGLHLGERIAAQGAFELLAPAGGGD